MAFVWVCPFGSPLQRWFLLLDFWYNGKDCTPKIITRMLGVGSWKTLPMIDMISRQSCVMFAWIRSFMLKSENQLMQVSFSAELVFDDATS